jgi:tetratricopeptide (TPR) repeat protein
MVLAAATSVAMSREAGDAARSALDRGQADDALKFLNTALQENPSDAEALNLRCRVLFAEERWDDAIAACERSVQIDPGSSSYHMWLGRAYGEKADRVSFVTAYKLAKLIRAEFESAASLDPHNGDALSDLGEYYVEAPKFLGGGTEKAEALATQMDGFAPDRAHELRARIAEHKKDYVEAEKEFRAKVSTAANLSHNAAAQSWMDLGSFYRRRERWDEMLAALQSGAAATSDHGSSLADGASTLIRADKEPELAAGWMQAYLQGNALSEEAPAFVVHMRLGDLYKKQGDVQRAQQEYAAARGLASGFADGHHGKTNTDR